MRKRGFTLLEMTIVIAILGVVMAGGAVMFAASLQKRQVDETAGKMQAIQQALLDFRRANNRIPCPADPTQAITSAYFGVEAANPSLCSGGTPAVNTFNPIVTNLWVGYGATSDVYFYNATTDAGIVPGSTMFCPDAFTCTDTQAGIAVATIVNSTHLTLVRTPTAGTNCAVVDPGCYFIPPVNPIVTGMVPTKTLNLPDDYAIDGWGRRIQYTVDPIATATNAFIIIPITSTATHLVVNDASGNPRTSQALYVLVSFGPDGLGAYPRNGGSTRIGPGTENTDEQTNCHCNSLGVGLTMTATFVQHAATQDPSNSNHINDFGDMVLYATRKDLRSLTE